MRSAAARLASLALAASLACCADLPSLDAGVCGNGVIDPGEDCDTYPVGPGTSCRPPGDPVGQCRLDCTPGSGHACPSGWGCGTDAVCREPNGSFVRQQQVVAADAWRLAMGDFDGDGRADVLARAAIDSGGYSRVRVEYYQPAAAHTVTLADTLVLAPSIASPVIDDFDGDGLSDLAFVDVGLDVMLGQANRTLAPVAYPAITVSGTAVLGSVHAYGPTPGDVLLVLFQEGSASGVKIELGSQPVLFSTAPDGPAQLAGDLVGAAFVEDPATRACDQLAMAFVGEDGADVYSPCALQGGKVVPNVAGPIAHVKLPGARTVDAGVRAADVDGDGHLDLVLCGGLGSWVAYGNGKGGFADASGVANVAGQLLVDYGETPVATIRCPLAAGDLDGDGKADFVTPEAIYLSKPQSSAYVRADPKQTGEWTAARIADLDADGLPDVVATANDELDAALFLGTGTTALNPFTIPTTGEVAALAVGDFDGDRVNDVMLAQSQADPSQPDQVTIAWGQAFAPPGAPVPVGQFATVDQGVPLAQASTTSSNLVVLAHPANAPGTALVSILLASGDRQPLAPYALLQQGGVAALPIALAAGPFLGSGHQDVALLAAQVNADGSFGSFAWWLAPGEAGAQFDAPVASSPLPSSFKPLAATVGTAVRDASLVASGPVRGGGGQAIVAAAPDGAQSSAFLPAVVTGGSSPAIASGDLVDLPVRVTSEGQLDFADLDGDGNADAVLLTGSNTGARALYVAWNDGSGGFSSAGTLAVNLASEVPQGFAFVRSDTGPVAHLAYVTRTALVLVTIDAAARTVSARATLDQPVSASGIAAGDVDGDGVEDLAEADDGDVVVLLGQAVLP